MRMVSYEEANSLKETLQIEAENLVCTWRTNVTAIPMEEMVNNAHWFLNQAQREIFNFLLEKPIPCRKDTYLHNITFTSDELDEIKIALEKHIEFLKVFMEEAVSETRFGTLQLLINKLGITDESN